MPVCVCVCQGSRHLCTGPVNWRVFVYVTVAGHADRILAAPEQLCNSTSIVVSRVQFLRQCAAVELSGVTQVLNINVFTGLSPMFLHEIVFRGRVYVLANRYYLY